MTTTTKEITVPEKVNLQRRIDALEEGLITLIGELETLTRWALIFRAIDSDTREDYRKKLKMYKKLGAKEEIL